MNYELIEVMPGRMAITFTDDAGRVWSIPEDETNSDYQAYLAWVEENK